MEDMSCFISKVVFTLHPSFAAPIREILEPPYQVSEFGWGEFEAGIRIFFRDPEEQPIDLIHQIKLYPIGPEGADLISQMSGPAPPNSKRPVVSEHYDEVVFTDPTENFKRLLMLYSADQTEREDVPGVEFYTKFDDRADLEQLAFVQDYVNRDTEVAKIRLLQLDAEYNQMISDPKVLTAPPLYVPSSSLLTGIEPPSNVAVDKMITKGSRGISGVPKVGTGPPKVTGPGPVGSINAAGNVSWNLKQSKTTGTAGNVGSKKTQAAAAAAAAVKHMENISSVR
eukprot:CAMPEP_0119038008 /NCGR_PEP_ID=MMETSP1177-20130426/6654_1 /TAXON_ID=2985 /ORGANISM="Ochromonas sp, Strain CCMP1899" /LENGTH=282 /DNA_ID=CAMNT_0007000007 /DNA_START=195 /DNA_END=1043 /DNA_ORIENTATION=+